MEHILKKLEETAKDVHYGNVRVDMTISRGRIVKLIIKEKERIILIDKQN